MATQGYEAVFVLAQTKKNLKIMCVQEEKTFDEMTQKLINFYKANTEEHPQFAGTREALSKLTIRK